MAGFFLKKPTASFVTCFHQKTKKLQLRQFLTAAVKPAGSLMVSPRNGVIKWLRGWEKEMLAILWEEMRDRQIKPVWVRSNEVRYKSNQSIILCG